MRTGTVSYKLEDLRKGVIIPIGMVGENDFTRVIFDAEEVFKKHPDAQVTMKVQPPKGGIYPATVTRDGNTVTWQVKAADVAHRGSGELQLTFTADTMVEKSYIARTDIKRSLVGNGPAPDPVQDWVDNAEEVLEDLEAAEVHQPIIGLDGYWYTWNQGTGEYEKTNTKAQGQDGHSPVLTSSKSGKTTTIFADGDQLAQILDGEDGQGADVIDDTAGEGDTDKTWSADKLDTEITDVKTAIQGLSAESADINANLKQLEKDGYQKYFPEWERGKYTESGKANDNNRVRSKEVIYLPIGTYTVYSAIPFYVYAYTTAEATTGDNKLWSQTGEKTFAVTTRNYIGFMADWSASNEDMPTGSFVIVPSAVSDVIEKAENNRIEIARVAAQLEYSEGIYTAVLTGATEHPLKSIGAGIAIGSAVTLANDNYQNVLEVPVVPGKTYRAKGRLYNNYYLIHFCNDNNVLISKTGQNTTGATTTIVDFTAVAPVGSTKMFIQSGKNTKILADVFEPYTVKQMIEMKDRKAIGSLCVMQFNVGDWYEGRYRDADHSGAIPADETIYENYMSLFTSIFDRYKPDIAMINEDAQEMCLNRHDDSRAFLKKYYKYLYRGLYQQQDYTDVYVTLATNLEMEDVEVIFYTNTESNMTKNLVKGYAYINGRKVCLICTHLSSQLDLAKLEAVELLNIIQTEDPEYMICCGDFNYDTDVSEVAAFETAGYEISRGNTVYNGHTYGYGDLTVTTPDTITVKSVFCDEQKIEADFVQYIDHLPTIVYLEVY